MLLDMDAFFRLYMDLEPGAGEGGSLPVVTTGPASVPRDVAE